MEEVSELEEILSLLSWRYILAFSQIFLDTYLFFSCTPYNPG